MTTDWQNRIVGYTTKRADQLTGNPRNPRRHPQKQRNAVKGSLDTLGWIAPVLENVRTGYLIDGHERVMQALGMGDDTQVPVIQVDLDEAEEAQALATFDFITYMAEYDRDNLDALLRETNSDNADIQALLAEIATEFDIVTEPEPMEAPEAQIDRAEELLQKWNVQRGDLWIIGEHRLLCGDSTSAEDVARVMGGERADLMVTDPPYGVSYAEKNKFLNAIDNGNRLESEIQNDHQSVDEMAELWLKCFVLGREYSKDNASYYVASPQGGELMMMMMMMIDRAGWQLKHTIIWVKNNHVLGRADYNYKHEPLIYGWNKTHTFYGAGQFKTSVWEIAKPLQAKDHPTMKPVELFAECLLNSSDKQNTIYDPFGGSGTTMVACEQLQRMCRMIEIEPKYCAVILERMSQMGLTPEKAHGETRTEN